MTSLLEYQSVQSSDGASIGYYKQGYGPPLVICHGSVGSSDDWHALTEILADDFTCFVYDRRGRARSGDGSTYSIASEIADIHLMMDIAGSGAHLLGHSYGGLCVLEYAREYGHLGPLILFEPPLPVEGPVAGPALVDYRSAIESGDNEEAMEIALTNFVRLPREALPQIKDSPLWDKIVKLAPTWTRELEQIDYLGLDIERYSIISGRQTRIITGTATSEFLFESAAMLNKIIEESTLTTMPDLDHFAHMVDPQSFAEVVRSGSC